MLLRAKEARPRTIQVTNPRIEGASARRPFVSGVRADRETDKRRYELFVQQADRGEQMGGPREPERPDRSMFT